MLLLASPCSVTILVLITDQVLNIKSPRWNSTAIWHALSLIAGLYMGFLTQESSQYTASDAQRNRLDILNDIASTRFVQNAEVTSPSQGRTDWHRRVVSIQINAAIGIESPPVVAQVSLTSKRSGVPASGRVVQNNAHEHSLKYCSRATKQCLNRANCFAQPASWPVIRPCGAGDAASIHISRTDQIDG